MLKGEGWIMERRQESPVDFLLLVQWPHGRGEGGSLPSVSSDLFRLPKMDHNDSKWQSFNSLNTISRDTNPSSDLKSKRDSQICRLPSWLCLGWNLVLWRIWKSSCLLEWSVQNRILHQPKARIDMCIKWTTDYFMKIQKSGDIKILTINFVNLVNFTLWVVIVNI